MATEPDYPYTPAPHRVVGSLEKIRELWMKGRVFGTGGAAVNDASLGANLALGYVVDERWRSYAPPAR
ncbi:hypothetical protein [Kribbella sp. ALI-6-A]|uniref:hypothetical protein n=1 Tax=Kribbella sp. ALI-6-A TaxID=1933817 RepID=UPI00117A21C7|nr:hypothetical protein [Kribbella sp. ALI-6-A]